MSDALKQIEDEILRLSIEKAREDFYTYVKLMAPVVLPEAFVDGIHIKLICQELQEIERSVWDKKMEPGRLQIFLPPGSMKSKIASNLFPSWCLGRHPNWCFLAIGSDFEFAVDNFGRPTKELIDSDQYQAIFPGTTLKKDVQSAGRWDTTAKGRFVARGAGQNIAGRRAHIAIVDDALTEQTTDTEKKKINTWYRKGLRTRLLTRGAEIIINTRWFVDDLSGFMMKIDLKSKRPWKVIEIPALLTEEASLMLRKLVPPDDLRFSPGTSFWPELWPTDKFLEIKETTPPHEWAALYMQKPVSEEGGIIKRPDFKLWEHPEPPKCRSVVISIDTALSQKEQANYSAYTVWGVFTNMVQLAVSGEGSQSVAQDSAILLSAARGRWDFAALCDKCKELDEKYQPDFFLVEETSAGLLLVPELRKRNIPVLAIKPERDKTFRLQATTPYFQAGRIWVPSDKMWAEEVVSEVISFNPRAKNQVDDYTDTVSQLIIWLRDNHKIDNDAYSNHWDEEIGRQRRTTYWGALTKRL